MDVSTPAEFSPSYCDQATATDAAKAIGGIAIGTAGRLRRAKDPTVSTTEVILTFTLPTAPPCQVRNPNHP